MATGASTADLAVILIDARKGVLTQTRRHTLSSSSLLGIRHVVLAVNKMDLVDYDAGGLRRDRGRLPRLRRAARLRRHHWRSRCRRCRATTSSSQRQHTPWYHGPDAAGASGDRRGRRRRWRDEPFRLPVQWVNRPNLDFRGFCRHHRGRHASSPATRSRSLPSGRDEHASRASSPSTATCTRRSPASRSR